MDKIVRLQFMGSWIIFWLMCITVIGLPLAFLYFKNSTLKIETEVPNAEEFVDQFRSHWLPGPSYPENGHRSWKR